MDSRRDIRAVATRRHGRANLAKRRLVGRLHRALSVRITSSLVVGLGIAVLFACGDPLRQDELDCEEAVSVLEGCCPGFQSSELQCVYQAPQGCGPTTYPAITEDESTCIRGESCSLLVSSGVCARAQQARAYTQGNDSPTEDGQPAQVCP